MAPLISLSHSLIHRISPNTRKFLSGGPRVLRHSLLTPLRSVPSSPLRQWIEGGEASSAESNRIGHWVLHPMMMIKEGGADLLPSSDPKAPSSAADAGVFGKGRYRFWALGAILLLAFWSMLTGTVTLRWSAGDFNRLAHDFDVPVAVNPDLDVLEMEEREKAVRHMWDVYAHAQTRRIRLPRFWQEAFEAAYQDLSGDDPDARDAAVAEIARMSVRMLDPEAPPRTPKAAEIKRNPRLRNGISSLKSGSSSSDAR